VGTLTVDQVLALLRESPRRIAALTAELTPAQLRTPPEPNSWSANDALAHLRSCADVWGDCIKVILAEDRPTLRAVNPRTWIKRTNYRELAFQPSLQAFLAQRDALLAVLEALPPEAWSRAAIVKGAGRTLERSVLFYAQWLAEHERSHVKQIGHIAEALRQPPHHPAAGR
jgi:hypothetical protein